MLEHVAADDRVKRTVVESQVGDVELKLALARVEVRRHVPDPGDASQAVLEAPLGGEMQQRPGAVQQLGPALEQEPQRPVALVGAAPPAQRVAAVPVVSEAVVAVPADRAADSGAAMAKHAVA